MGQAYEQPLFKVGLYPSDDDRTTIATNQFYGVMLGNAKNVAGTGKGNAAIVYPTANGPIFGVLQNNPMQGEAAELIAEGITKARASGAFSVGDLLMVDAHGAFLKSDGASSTTVVAMAVMDADAGDVVSIRLK
jgi:predicted RecA/RadA family phage recombinase